MGRLAVVINTAGFILTSDIPAVILQILAKQLHIEPFGLSGMMATILLMRPTSLVLLVMSMFYLWVYGWRVQAWQSPMGHDGSQRRLPMPLPDRGTILEEHPSQ